jgi:hypothetical protein
MNDYRPPTRTEKRCTGCNETKPLEVFGPDPMISDGLQSRCRQCKAAATQEWRARRRAEIAAKALA